MRGTASKRQRLTGNRHWYVFLCTLLALALAGCGGRSGGGDGTDETDDDIPTAEQITLQASSVRLASSGESPVEITALLRDANNNVVEGVDVQFSSDSGSLQVTQGTTDAAGQALAELTPGNPENRTIQVTASQGNDQASIDIEVFGTELAINGPGSLNPGGSGDYTVTLQDSAGDPIANQTVMVSSAQGNTITQSDPTTDSTGQAQFTLTSVGGGDDTLTVNALGGTSTLDIEVSNNVLAFTSPAPGTLVEIGDSQTLTVDLTTTGADDDGQPITFSASRGTLNGATPTTDGNGEATVDISSGSAGPATITAEADLGSSTPTTSLAIDFIATDPQSLNLEASPSQIAPTESSTITATVRDADGNLVRDQQITFNLVQDSTNGSLDRSQAITNAEGRASVVYTASSTTSSQSGIEITASVSATSISDTVSLTVGGEALRLSLNTGNTLNAPNESQYQEPWSVLVTDASGNPVDSADVELSITPLVYYKGNWIQVDTDGDGEADAWGKAYSSSTEGQLDQIGQFRCDSEDSIPVSGLDPEDTRFNGVLDENNGDTEDIDADGRLEPENTATVSRGTVTTDDTGFAQFVVAYPQGNATWTRVRLEGTVSVAGSEQSEATVFDLRVLADDVSDLEVPPPGGTEGPYGEIGDCTDLR